MRDGDQLIFRHFYEFSKSIPGSESTFRKVVKILSGALNGTGFGWGPLKKIVLLWISKNT